MKKRTPNLLFMLLVFSSVIVFSYFNFCPSAGESGLNAANRLMEVPKEIVLLPEFEMVINAAKAVIDFIMP